VAATDDLTIRKLIEEVLGGRIRVPAFQRGFVWDADLVAYLMDSLYKGYPVGAVLFWRTRTPLRVEKDLGPFRLPERTPDYPLDYVLDGQQRITSLFGVFQNDVAPRSAEEAADFEIYFNFRADEDAQDTQFEPVESPVDFDKYFPLRTLFDSVAYRKATEVFAHDEAALRRVDEMQTRFKEAKLPIQAFETDNKAQVAIVFERVNRLGIGLDTYQLLTAWTWSEDFDLQEQFEALGETLKPFGFEGVGEDTNLLLRCCAAIIGHDASPEALIDLNGASVRTRMDEVRNGISGAIDFLRTNVHVEALKNLPFFTLLVPLAVFFAAADGVEVRVSAEQRSTILRWFWRACFSRRYSSGVLRNLKTDIDGMAALRETGISDLDAIPFSVDEDYFLGNTFKIGAVNTKTFVLLLAQQQPRSFISGNPVSLAEMLKNYNRTEFHHCYPQAYLRGRGVSVEKISCLANIAFVSSTENKQLGGAAPSKYREKMNDERLSDILEHALCTDALFSDDFDRFVRERASLLTGAAQDLMG
jgi:hypothetical protein